MPVLYILHTLYMIMIIKYNMCYIYSTGHPAYNYLIPRNLRIKCQIWKTHILSRHTVNFTSCDMMMPLFYGAPQSPCPPKCLPSDRHRMWCAMNSWTINTNFASFNDIMLLYNNIINFKIKQQVADEQLNVISLTSL